VTFSFDPLILNIFSRAGVTCSNDLPNVSEIEQPAAELMTIKHIFAVQFLRVGGGGKSPEGSQGCVDRTLQNLEGT